ncbi:MAG: chromosome segregation protein SMC [Elusimicrobia bacterium]|nr:chromosome segregation protein SMC [Elusimicrobiota bacterium]
MYLKTIEIVGYKSFADKTRLEFEPGITGIVGPNGCGKSNVMDAIRWCLGEMSWKSLRAGAMTDVIFAGSKKRQPLGMTEVSLIFDNAKNLLPISYSEVTVTRRIFRSGEGEYLLNRTPCRLKDIRELFLDTGIGSDGYAIIDQGGVEFVLRATPEERRGLFEEAAGVSKFKAKREEALRKLDRVDVDLGRLKDSVALIAEQVRHLDAEARKAKLFKKYKEELTALEVGGILLQMDEAVKRLGEIAVKAAPHHEKLGLLKAELSAENAHKSAIDLEKALQSNVVIEKNRRSSEIGGEIARLEERVKAADAAAAAAAGRRETCSAERAAALSRLSFVDPEIESARAALAAAEAERDRVRREVSGTKARFDAASTRLSASEAELEGIKSEKTRLTGDCLEASRRLGDLESSVTHLIGELRSSLKTLVRDEAAAETAREGIRSQGGLLAEHRVVVESGRAEAAAAAAGLDAVRGRLAGSCEGLSAVGRETLETNLKISALEAEGGKDPYWAGAQAVVSAGIEGVLGTVQSVLEAKEGFRASIEDALGERLHAVLCEDSAAAQAGVDYLAETGRGRGRFLVLSSLPVPNQGRTYPANTRPLLEVVSCEPKFEAAVRFLLEECYLLGRAVYGDHWVCGGAAQAPGRASVLLDLDGFKSKQSSLKTREAELAGLKAGLEAELSGAESRHREAQDKLASAFGRETDLTAGLTQMELAASVQAGNVAMSTTDAAEKLQSLALMKEESLLARAAKAEAGDREKAAGERERVLREVVSACREEMAQAAAFQKTAEGTVNNAETGVTLRRQTLEGQVSEGERLGSTLAARDNEIIELDARRDEARQSKASAIEGSGRLRTELEAADAEAKTALDRLHELESQARDKEVLTQRLGIEIRGEETLLQDLELEAGSARTRSEMHKTRLWEEWQLAEPQARESYTVTGPVDPERIEALRKRIAGMGNINLAAPEDYEALSGKQASLEAQIQDMEKAKEDLRAAIQKINSTTRENFRQTFMEVREHFRRLYGVLFEGGEADLVLQDPDNLLETGIDIVAQPPGKKLQHLSLLSGGEKSLTAIALLFSFFSVRPSPFCLLDEADAALDDANIERFVSLIREFQNKTQFCIISHNKRTMEATEAIYGVTMEEAGVSQVVSIDFNKKKRETPRPAEGASLLDSSPVPAAGVPAEAAPSAAPAAPETKAETPAGEPFRAPPPAPPDPASSGS